MPIDLSKRYYPDDFKSLVNPPKTYTNKRGDLLQFSRDLKRKSN